MVRHKGGRRRSASALPGTAALFPALVGAAVTLVLWAALSPGFDASAAAAVLSALAVALLVADRAAPGPGPEAGEERLARQLDLAHLSRQHLALMARAMEDPDLAAVLDTYDVDVPVVRQKQFLYANALYANAVQAYLTDSATLEELLPHLRLMCRNQIFRDYWKTTGAQRATLLETSREARLGREVDRIVDELLGQTGGRVIERRPR
ncbi:DUF6082 family protein [Streptomyces sp. NPDC001941]|uniref:DUF6082 family protein n=1 Tax=Streptomyces sp. NPDC001941 TaxID=3154659 RepID=UPI003326DAA6